jgi:hypothetical protein
VHRFRAGEGAQRVDAGLDGLGLGGRGGGLEFEEDDVDDFCG